ncbi:MAG: TIGR00730 family Rossman fold protein [Saprospiraceae bacterium]|uniref:Cytokinin riboside 5'-monophosphate phosphoribohydrolase n=1 Tax=Candidatus Opimibacter skivensis TaxID=2982028 RepID=A0A9D7XRG0_9BACT|nr:TIGR00730 family Rossman fold protein [Candidatus Opimibacter skivensis]
MNVLKSICVYCGSSTGVNPVYMQDAIALMQIFLEHQIRLINGGGNIGLMGVMADAMLRGKGEAIGVIPIGLKQKEVAHTGMTELHVVPDMHSRKLMMVNLSDAFIAFPGGFGTMDEVFETLTWAQLHLHQKPILLYNPDHFYDHLLYQADHMLKEGFLNKNSRSLLLSTSDLNQVLPLLQNFKASFADQWTLSKKEGT